MMTLTPFLMLSMTTMTFSTIMVMSSSNWIMLWIALELNLLSFIPIMLSSNQLQETEASVKYMLAQALGSSILLMSSLSLYSQIYMPKFMMSIVLIAIMIKIGMVPCHMWYPSVMSSISWISAFILTSWQKLAPLSILMFIMMKTTQSMMMLIAMMNALLGGLMGLNQTQLRTIMAYSSITHLGWMLSLIYMSMSMMSLIYFLIYVSVISPIFMFMNKMNLKTLSQINKGMTTWSTSSIMLSIMLLSLAGMPPLLGFLPKLMTILLVNSPTLLMALIAGSLMNLYYYLNITFSTMLSINKLNMKPTHHKLNSFTLISSMMAMIFLPLLMI